MTKEQVDELLILKEQGEMKEDEFNELVSKLKKHFVEFKKDAGISNITTPTTGKVNNNTEVKKSVIFPDCPRNEKWSDETILNIVNFVNSCIIYDEKQYTIRRPCRSCVNGSCLGYKEHESSCVERKTQKVLFIL